jgi:CheY-like chemotaxis protein
MARVLIVDDNATVRRFLEVAMKRAGHETCLAIDGEDALRLHAETAPDLVILDIFMPKKDGIQTIIELRRRAPGLPIIALSAGWAVGKVEITGGRQYDVLEDALAAGANLALEKPIQPATLNRAVSELLATRQ